MPTASFIATNIWSMTSKANCPHLSQRQKRQRALVRRRTMKEFERVERWAQTA
jgi:hypothetical protein